MNMYAVGCLGWQKLHEINKFLMHKSKFSSTEIETLSTGGSVGLFDYESTLCLQCSSTNRPNKYAYLYHCWGHKLDSLLLLFFFPFLFLVGGTGGGIFYFLLYTFLLKKNIVSFISYYFLFCFHLRDIFRV